MGILKSLQRLGLDIDHPSLTSAETWLHRECKFAGIRTVKSLLSCGADVPAKDDWGRTPLAAHLSNVNSSQATSGKAELLLKHSPREHLSSRDKRALTPLQSLVISPPWFLGDDIALTLLKSGADLFLPDKIKKTSYDYLQTDRKWPEARAFCEQLKHKSRAPPKNVHKQKTLRSDPRTKEGAELADSDVP